MISPSYPRSSCGISTYTGYLTADLRLVAEVTTLGVQREWARGQPLAAAVEQADVVHIQHAISNLGYMGTDSFSLYWRLKRLGKPILTTLHELPLFERDAWKEHAAFLYLKFLLQYVVQSSDLVWVHSDKDVAYLTQWGIQGNIHVIPHGTIFARVTDAPRESLPPPRVIGFFGFINANKGVHRIIDALTQLPDVRVKIAGEPKDAAGNEYFNSLQQRVIALGLTDRVEFLGFLPDEKMAEFFASVGVVAFPYSSSTASGALHLALAHRSVVLASDIPLFCEMKANYHCLETFQLDDPASLVSSVQVLLSDMSRRTELIAACGRMISETSWAAVTRRTVDAYREVIEAHPKSERQKS